MSKIKGLGKIGLNQASTKKLWLKMSILALGLVRGCEWHLLEMGLKWIEAFSNQFIKRLLSSCKFSEHDFTLLKCLLDQ